MFFFPHFINNHNLRKKYENRKLKNNTNTIIKEFYKEYNRFMFRMSFFHKKRNENIN